MKDFIKMMLATMAGLLLFSVVDAYDVQLHRFFGCTVF